MPRFLIGLAAVLATTGALAQNPLADLPNLVPNPGFEEGAEPWVITIGPYGQAADRWAAAKGVAEVIDRDAEAGERCLRLNAVGQDNEVDVHSPRVPVEAGAAYLLDARVRQVAGTGNYKVVIDWIDADGEHVEYDNDWKGQDRPSRYANHGGVFTAPDDAAEALIILGVQKDVECLFDEIRLLKLPIAPGATVPDGAGSIEAELPREVPAGGEATFKVIYTAGEGGLPIGSKLGLRRTNNDPRWSPVQTADPEALGYTSVEASNGALCMVQPGGPDVVPSITNVTVLYPPLDEGDTVTMTYRAQVQPKAEKGVRFALALDGDQDDRALDIGETEAFDIVAGEFAELGLIAPAVVEVGTEFALTAVARDAHGNTVGETRSVTNRVTVDQPGAREVSASMDGIEVTREVIASNPPGDDALLVGNERVRLVLPRNDFGYGVGFLEARDGDGWARVGAFSSMGEIWVGDGDAPRRVPMWLAEASVENDVVRLSGTVKAGGRWDVQVVLSVGSEAGHVDIECAATPRGSSTIRAFYAPILHAGDGSFGATKTGGLFPGVEYLAGDEVSSGDYGIVPPHSDRTNPHPYKITVPMMAVISGGLGAMLSWDPLQEWRADKRYPCAVFGSPARLDDRDNHLMAVFAPSQFEGVDENARQASEPFTVAGGETLRLRVSAAALSDVEHVTDVFGYYARTDGLPDVPAAARDDRAEEELIAQGLLETAWDEEEKGWHNALADPWGAAYNGQIALLLAHHAMKYPQSPLAEPIAEQLASAGGLRGFDAAFIIGNAADAVAAERSQGMRDMLSMAADGSYAFHPHDGDKIFNQAQSKSMGADGEVVVGTCVMGLEPLARRALLTGDPDLIEHLERGLAFIDRFDRPQGSEHWEVPLACPNLRASALAARCYLYGYRLTGKPEYLEKASYWAQTGLPFIYMWQAADREVMPYASISVMGSTLHTHTWFGRAVQWVGVVYADALHELAGYDATYDWDSIAEGIVVSAMQQQKLAGAECGHTGFYPDAWSLMDGDEAYHWCLAPTLIGQAHQALLGTDPRASVSVARVGDRAISVASPGEVSLARSEGDALRFSVRHAEGITHEIVVSQIADAAEVLVNDQALRRSDLADGQPGWQATDHGSLRLRVKQVDGGLRIEVRGFELAPTRSNAPTEALGNGGFEDGLKGWTPSPVGGTTLDADAHSGDTALAVDATRTAGEAQCTSAPMRVTPGTTYELAAWVKQATGAVGYKIGRAHV